MMRVVMRDPVVVVDPRSVKNHLEEAIKNHTRLLLVLFLEVFNRLVNRKKKQKLMIKKMKMRRKVIKGLHLA